jgi:hypothetical protein
MSESHQPPLPSPAPPTPAGATPEQQAQTKAQYMREFEQQLMSNPEGARNALMNAGMTPEQAYQYWHERWIQWQQQHGRVDGG